MTMYLCRKIQGLDFDGDANLLLTYDGVRCRIFLEKIIHNSCMAHVREFNELLNGGIKTCYNGLVFK